MTCSTGQSSTSTPTERSSRSSTARRVPSRFEVAGCGFAPSRGGGEGRERTDQWMHLSFTCARCYGTPGRQGRSECARSSAIVACARSSSVPAGSSSSASSSCGRAQASIHRGPAQEQRSQAPAPVPALAALLISAGSAGSGCLAPRSPRSDGRLKLTWPPRLRAGALQAELSLGSSPPPRARGARPRGVSILAARPACSPQQRRGPGGA